MIKVGDIVEVLPGYYENYPSGSCYNISCGPVKVIQGSTEEGYIKVEHYGEVSPPLNPNCFRHVHPAAPSGAQREKLNDLPYDLVPFREIAEAYARVAEKGAKKYSPWNWTLGFTRIQIIGSLLRHTWAYLRGEDHDDETGLLHTDHILWNAAALSHNVHWNLEDGRRAEPDRDYKAADSE